MRDLFEKINNYDLRPIREIVLENLRNGILTSKIKPGDRLVETVIAEAMGVSRTPVREALRQLELEGLATNIPRRGTVVNGISSKVAMEIYDLREVMEGLAVRLATINISEENLTELRSIIKNMEDSIKEKDFNKLSYNHNKWNEVMMLASQNEQLIKQLQNLYEYLSMLRIISLYSDDFKEKSVEEHKEILKAIEEKDQERSEILARQHVKNAKARFLKSSEKFIDR